VLVSHDRHLTGLVCDTFWRVADGRVELFDGDLDDYAGWLRARGSSASVVEQGKSKSPPVVEPTKTEEKRRKAGKNR
jgi:ATP-binding cassette subfamily F protein 3